MADVLYRKGVINIIWSNPFILEAAFQKIANLLATSHGLPEIPIAETVAQINPSLSSLGFEIRRGILESDGSPYFALCNVVIGQGSELATHFSPAELTFFRLLIKTITKSTAGSVERNVAINLRIELEDMKVKMSIPEAEKVLMQLETEFWLSRNSDETLALGPRSVLELRQYIEGEYPEDIKECVVCTDLVFKGEGCRNDKCLTRFHHHCALKWFHGKPRKCPTCTQPWQDAPQGWEDKEPLPQPKPEDPNAIRLD